MDRTGARVETIFGVQLIDLEVFRDERGDLVAIEEPSNLPFTLKRIFYMKIGQSDVERANHATSSDLFVTPVIGSAVMDVDNGREHASLTLDSCNRGIWTRPGIYIRLRSFARPTVLLVCASKFFADTRYFQAPQPHLIGAEVLA